MTAIVKKASRFNTSFILFMVVLHLSQSYMNIIRKGGVMSIFWRQIVSTQFFLVSAQNFSCSFMSCSDRSCYEILFRHNFIYFDVHVGQKSHIS